MIIQAKDYSSRSQLENKVRNTFGLTADMKPDHVIKGTRAELAKLRLSDKNIFWGIKCEITDTPTKSKKQKDIKKIKRGK